MFKLAIPVLHVSGSAAAEEFYCNRLGFRRDFAYRPFGGLDPFYEMGLTRDGVELHVSSFSGDGVSGGMIFLGDGCGIGRADIGDLCYPDAAISLRERERLSI